MTIKKIISVACAALMLASVGCGDKQTGSTAPDNDYSAIYNYGGEYFKSIGKRVTLDFDSDKYIYNKFGDGINGDIFSVAAGT